MSDYDVPRDLPDEAPRAPGDARVYPGREWLEKMAALEDEHPHFGVGGLASDMGMLDAPCGSCGGPTERRQSWVCPSCNLIVREGAVLDRSKSRTEGGPRADGECREARNPSDHDPAALYAGSQEIAPPPGWRWDKDAGWLRAPGDTGK